MQSGGGAGSPLSTGVASCLACDVPPLDRKRLPAIDREPQKVCVRIVA